MASSYRNVCIRACCTNKTKEGVVNYDIDTIKNIITNWNPTQEYEIMLHNQGKDSKQPHIHIVLKLKSPVSKERLINKFPYCNIEGIKSNYAKCVQYLIHANDSDKVQYPKSEIVSSLKNIDKYFIEDSKEQSAKLNDIIYKIMNGEIKEYDYFNKIEYVLYCKYKTIIKNAFSMYIDKIVSEIRHRDITVCFYHGNSGSGKTLMSKEYCKNNNLSYCISSGSKDPLQDYSGEDVLILDDLRDDVFKFDDLLKILDNNTNSSINSRYKNKFFIGSMIIITSTVELKDWYQFEDHEEKLQLYRRVTEMFKFDNNKIVNYGFNSDTKKYEKITEMSNPILNIYNKGVNDKGALHSLLMEETVEKMLNKNIK